MNTAIVINLDHERLGADGARQIWGMIETALVGAGFVKNNRVFLSVLPPDQAFAAARKVVDELEVRLVEQGLSLYGALLEFYGMDYLNTENLMVPSPNSIVVSGSIASGSAA